MIVTKTVIKGVEGCTVRFPPVKGVIFFTSWKREYSTFRKYSQPFDPSPVFPKQITPSKSLFARSFTFIKYNFMEQSAESKIGDTSFSASSLPSSL